MSAIFGPLFSFSPFPFGPVCPDRGLPHVHLPEKVFRPSYKRSRPFWHTICNDFALRWRQKMPDSTERKRQRRAEQAAAQGKTYKPRKHPCLREQPPPPAQGGAEPQEVHLTMEEELNRARMEVEDCRVRVQALMKASASLTSFYQSWLQPKQRVRLRPHYEHVIGLMPKERGLLHQLDSQTTLGRWRVSPVEGPNKGRPLFTDVPPEALMP